MNPQSRNTWILVLLLPGIAGAVALFVAVLGGQQSATPLAGNRVPGEVEVALRAQLDELARRIDQIQVSPRDDQPGDNAAAGPDPAVLLAAIRQLDQRLAKLEQAVAHAPSPGNGKAGADNLAPPDWPQLRTEIEQLHTEITQLRQVVHKQGQPTKSEREPTANAAKGSNPTAPRWGARQALGNPDAPLGVDAQTAWAPAQANGGIEWLEFDIAEAVQVNAVVIRESLNPGFVSRVELLDDNSKWHTVWTGNDPTSVPGDFVVALDEPVLARTARVWVDTVLVNGWNEIDAVGLRAGGTIHWATDARASSEYASGGLTVGTASFD
ncbi:MAG: discoidin domain-containing protein [Planctomycetota bacterium]